MRAAALAALAVLAGGCQLLVGIEETSIAPDAASDAAVDAPIDAPPPPVDVGSGADGDLLIGVTTYADEVRTQLTMPVGGGSTLLHVGSVDGLAIGDEIVIMQMTGGTPGMYETRRIAATRPLEITLDAPVSESYAVGGGAAAQVLRVPHYGHVMIPAGGLLTAHAWDGLTGGVMFFRALSLRVSAGGAVRVDGAGYAGAEGGAGGAGGEGALGGNGGGSRECPVLGCGTATAAGWGAPGLEEQDGPPGASGGPAVHHNSCRSGGGGIGGFGGGAAATEPGGDGSAAVDPGGGAAGGGGARNASENLTRPLLGGGGGGGGGGTGGIGGSGGGGGGGSVANGVGPGQTGGRGGSGGTGGTGGAGGIGGGVVVIFAGTIELDGSGVPHGTISASGQDGADGVIGDIGGTGGTGGFGPFGPNCSGAFVHGGRGGGGQGATGGTGGNGGGGGAGGTIVLSAYTLRLAGDVRALGGTGGDPGPGGPGGLGGMGYAVGPTGDEGVPGTTAGEAGMPGFVYLRYVDACDDCAAATDPPATVIDL